MNKQETSNAPVEEQTSARLFWALVVASLAAYSIPLWHYAVYVSNTELHSHCLLIPFVVGYLIWLSSGELVLEGECSFSRGIVFLLSSLGVVWALLSGAASGLSENDRHGLWVLAFLLSILSLLVSFYGWGVLGKWRFPIAFLFFMIPLPDLAAELLEKMLMTASAHLTYFLFLLAGTSVDKEGQTLLLPVIELEVARQCSGIRSTWVLFLTALLGSYLLLQSAWARVIILASILPLGILRNSLRIFVIGQLCMAGGPEMIDHWLHRRGGPLFFGVSLIPLFILVALLKWGEKRRPRGPEKGETG